MPKHSTKEYNERLRMLMEHLRQSVEDARNKRFERHANIVPEETNEQEIVENIEEVPKQEEVVISGLNRPRGRSNGGRTNLSIGNQVEVRNDGGEIY